MPVPPKIDPVRRNARSGPRKLPAGGRKGPTPPWPLPDKRTLREVGLWKQLWGTPQAAAWEELGWTRTVARYCRVLLAAEAMVKDFLPEARQLEDRLGLTPKSMRVLLWEIAHDEVAEQREAPTVRGRLKAVG